MALLGPGVKIEKPTGEPVQLHITSDIGMHGPVTTARWNARVFYAPSTLGLIGGLIAGIVGIIGLSLSLSGEEDTGEVRSMLWENGAD